MRFPFPSLRALTLGMFALVAAAASAARAGAQVQTQIYAIYDLGGTFVVGQFNDDSTTVNPALVSPAPGFPTAVAVGGGHLYVADAQNRVVDEYNLDGTTAASGLIGGFDYPGALAVSGGHLFVGDAVPGGAGR